MLPEPPASENTTENITFPETTYVKLTVWINNTEGGILQSLVRISSGARQPCNESATKIPWGWSSWTPAIILKTFVFQLLPTQDPIHDKDSQWI